MSAPAQVGDVKVRARRALGQLVKATAAAADTVARPAGGVVALLYHRVGGGSGLELDLPTAVFDRQMAALASGCRVMSYDAAVNALTAAPHSGTGTGVTVTFDDGTADFVDEALPVLVRHGVPAILFVATQFVDEGRPFPRGGIPLSWSALADAVATGLVTVGSHTHRHRLLDRLPPAEVAAELDRSIDLIEDRLGVTPRHFAYPKAVAAWPAAVAEVRRRFRSAALAGTRANRYGATDPYRLARSPIQAGDGMRWFPRKVAGGMALEDRLRALANRRRYAGMST
jgi:peptidoglycan/xylan/chitin deacetylase (PgdA/CDA1 family)